MCNLVFAPTEDEALDAISSVLAGTANHVFRFTLEGKGVPEDIKERLRGLMGEYQSRHHAQPGASNPNNALLAKYGLREWLARQGTIAGPPSLAAPPKGEDPDWPCQQRVVPTLGAGTYHLRSASAP